MLNSAEILYAYLKLNELFMHSKKFYVEIEIVMLNCMDFIRLVYLWSLHMVSERGSNTKGLWTFPSKV
jgi:hypothetical protein